VIRTVLGPIPPGKLGITSSHEHLWMDGSPLLGVHGYAPGEAVPWDASVAAEARWNPGVHPANYRFTDADAVVEELGPFVTAGGRALVELTPPGLGRDAGRVRDIARRAGIHVVLGTGQYLEPAHEPWVGAASEAELVERLVADATDGLDGTDVRPGIYGEIGTGDPLTPGEARVLRAVAAASRMTDLAISVHLHPWGHEGTAVLDTLIAAGADSTRVVLGHLTTAIDRPDQLRSMADRGATLGFDLFGFDHSLLGPGRWPPSDRDVALAIAALVADGYGDRIVLGQDIGVRTRLRRWGGWGYAHLLEHVVPLLGEVGVGDAAIDAMLVHTPARLLAVPAIATEAALP
jgi:phosphotriesterase-related protein